jgi:hypothetical protein
LRTPFRWARGDAVRGVGTSRTFRDTGEERVGMRVFDALPVVLPDTRRVGDDAGQVGGDGRHVCGLSVSSDVNVTADAYNPQGGKRVQLAWLRYSTSLRHAARPYGLRVGPVRPAACR